MRKTYKLTFSYSEFKKLSDAYNLAEAPQRVQQLFVTLGIRTSRLAKIIPSSVDSLLCYVIFTGNHGLNIYSLELKADGTDMLIAEDLTPTISNNVNAYPIYQTGVPLYKDGIASYISGEERERLSGRQLKKWDYFFRASRSTLLYWHRLVINDLKRNIEAYNQQIASKGIKVGLMVAGAIILYFSIWKIVAIGLSAYAFYQYRQIFIDIFRAITAVKAFESAIVTFEEEASYLDGQLDQQPATDQEIRDWLDTEIKQMDTNAYKELRIDVETEIRELDISLKSRNTVGLNIEEWGMIQPNETNGKRTINKPQHFFHQLGVRINQNSYVYAVYYVNLLYMTERGLGIYTCFYDFILEKIVGPATNFYHYKDIVSIGSKVVDSQVLDNAYELETKQTIITFYNSERIVITLTDGTAMKSLGEQIEAQKHLESLENRDELSLLDYQEYERLLELADDNPLATRSNAILANVKEYWNAHKNIGGANNHLT